MTKYALFTPLIFVIICCTRYNSIESVQFSESNSDFYADSLNGFSFRYPKSWKTLGFPGYIFYASQNNLALNQKVHINFSVSIVGERIGLRKASKIKENEWFNSDFFRFVNIRSRIGSRFNNEEAIDYEVSATIGSNEVYWFYKLVSHDGKIYGLSTVCQHDMMVEGQLISHSILKSFKFL